MTIGFLPETEALSWAACGYGQWHQSFKKLDSDDLMNMADAAAELAVRLGMVACYCMWRGAAGAGDHALENVIKAVERRRIEMRRALHYRYPEAR